MRREVEAIRKVLIAGKREVNANPMWRSISEKAEAGDIKNKRIHFSASDIERLRHYVIQNTGVDPTLSSLKEGRIEQSLVSNNEKLATGGVFDTMILMGRPKGGSIPAKGFGEIPPGSLVAISESILKSPNTITEPVVIVENGAVMAHLANIHWPEDLPNPIVLYRGHGTNLPMLRSWLLEIPNRENVIPFFDFDPAGLDMTRQYKVRKCIIPNNWQFLTIASEINNPDKYLEQVSARDSLSNDSRLSKELRKHIATNKIALMQEHMVSHLIPLSILNFE